MRDSTVPIGVETGRPVPKSTCGNPGAVLLMMMALRNPGPHQRFSVENPEVKAPRSSHIPLCPQSRYLTLASPNRCGRSIDPRCQGNEYGDRSPGAKVSGARGN